MTKSAFCLAKNEDHARRIVDRLQSTGLKREEISLIYPDKNNRFPKRDVPKGETKDELPGTRKVEKHTKAPEGATTGALTGGILGGSLGLLAGIGALAIPGLGPVIAAGPIMAALSGSAVGGSLGLLIGALVGSGIPEYEAKKYESGLKAGQILISVHPALDRDAEKAVEAMKQENASEISTSSEKAGVR